MKQIINPLFYSIFGWGDGVGVRYFEAMKAMKAKDTR